MSAKTASLKPARRSGPIVALFGANIRYDGGAVMLRTALPCPNRRMSLQARAPGVCDTDRGSLGANGFPVTAQSPSSFRGRLKHRGKVKRVWGTISFMRAVYL